jgi:hypothetical protein
MGDGLSLDGKLNPQTEPHRGENKLETGFKMALE